MARSIDSLSFVGSVGVIGSLVSKWLYFVQLMKRFVMGGEEETGVLETSSRIGLWSEESSFKL